MERLRACRGQVMKAKPWSFMLPFYRATEVYNFPFSKLSQAAMRTWGQIPSISWAWSLPF